MAETLNPRSDARPERRAALTAMKAVELDALHAALLKQRAWPEH